MTAGLESLEKKIAGLITQFRDAKQRIRELEVQVREGIGECERLEQENEGLRARIQDLEGEVASRGEREELVKNKLEQIIGQIDSLETEIAQIEATG